MSLLKTSVFASWVLGSMLSMTPSSQAELKQIQSLYCQGTSAATGITTITYTGASYVNITNIAPFTLPFSQQAKVVDGDLSGSTLTLNLFTVLTQSSLRLELNHGTNKGRLIGDNGSYIDLTCTANIQ